MLIYEIALNAVTHGGAQELTLEAQPGLVHVRDSGGAFGLVDLLRGALWSPDFPPNRDRSGDRPSASTRMDLALSRPG